MAEATRLNDLLKKTDVTKQQEATLDRIRSDLDALLKKQDKMTKEEEKRIDELKAEMTELYKQGSIQRRKEIASIIGDLTNDVKNIKENISDYTDNVKLSFVNLGTEFQETKKQTQVLMEEKLIQFGEVAGEKINLAAQFIGSAVKDAIDDALDVIGEKINYVLNNLGSLIKSGFDSLKNAILKPIEYLKSLPAKIINNLVAAVKWTFNAVKNVISGALKLAYNAIIGTVKFLFNTVLKVLKGIVWAIGKVFQGLFWMVKQAFAIVYKIASKVLSFMVSVVWGAIKAVGRFLINIVWATIKTIAFTVVKIAWTLFKTITQTIVTAILSAFAPWLGLIALVGVGIYYLGKYFGWWGGNKDTAPGSPESGGFFSNILGMISDKLVEWWGVAVSYLWNDQGTGILNKAWNYLWNDSGDGVIQKFFSFAGGFFKMLWGKLIDFWEWVQSGSKTSDPEALRKEKFDRLQETINNLNIGKESLIKSLSGNNDIESIKAIRSQLVEINTKTSKIRTEQEEVNRTADKQKAALAPMFNELMKDKTVQTLMRGASILGTRMEDLSSGKASVNEETIQAMKDLLVKSSNEKGLSQDQQKSIADALKSIQSYEEKAQDLVGRKSGLVGDIVNGLSEWWTKPKGGKEIIGTFIFGNAAIQGDTGGLWGAISKLITGHTSGGWSSPTGDSVLGKLFEVIFGKPSIDWGTSSGLIGTIKDFIQFKVVFPIKEFFANTIIPFFDRIMGAIGNVLERFVPGGKALNKGISSARGYLMEASSNIKADVSDEKKKRLHELTTQRTSADQPELSSSQMSLYDDLLNSQYSGKFTTKINPEEFARIKNNFTNTATRYALGFFAAGDPNANTQPGVAQAAARNIKESYGSLLSPELPEWLSEDLHSGAMVGLGRDFVSRIIKDPANFQNNISTLKGDIQILKAGGIDAEVISKYENLLDRLSGFDQNLQVVYDKWTQRSGIFGDRRSPDSFASDLISRSMGALASQFAQEFRGLATFGYMDQSAGEQIAKSEGWYLGLERGGLIKPRDGGVNIIAAEAGDPEIVLPLNSHGLEYINKISASMQPSSNDDNVMSKIMGYFETKAITKENREPTTRNPILPATNIKNSDSTHLDLLKLVSMGILSK